MIARIVVGIVAALLLVGCQSAGPGIQVQVRAEPKKGYKPPSDHHGYGGSDIPGHVDEPGDREFKRIDYRNLDEIVVWAEPADRAELPPPRDTMLPLASASAGVGLASVGGKITVNLQQLEPSSYFLRGEDGQIIPLSPGKSVFVPAKPGLIELLGEKSDLPVASIYVAPTSWASTTKAGKRVTFAPLPAGQYRVSTWHPILPGGTQVVDVAAGKLSKLTLTVGVNSLPKPK